MSTVNRRSVRGQALVELALVVPLLALLLIALAEFGFLLYAHVQVTNAAQSGARAGSLFLSRRFYYTSCLEDSGCPPGFGPGDATPDCWTFRDWVENGLAERVRTAGGCPAAGFTAGGAHAFGRLVPALCPGSTSGTNCWWLGDLTSNSVLLTGPPTPGTPLEVGLEYRFDMPFLGNLLHVVQSPVVIQKRVVMAVQAN